MTGYELVFITDPSHNNDELASVLKNYKKILTKSGGKLIHEYVWGRRRLAYEISGNDFGVYHAWYFTGTGKTIDEFSFIWLALSSLKSASKFLHIISASLLKGIYTK